MKKVFDIMFFILILVVIIWLMFTVKFISWDFRNELWAPSYLLWHGESAYNTTILFPISLAVWFPQIIGLFFPLGLLPEYLATNLWLLINIVLLIYLTWFLIVQANTRKPTLLLFPVLLASVFLFPPTVRLLMLGQVDVVFMAAAIAGTYALKQNHPVPGGFLYALALTKPQLAMVVLPCLIGYLLFIKKDWQGTIKFSLSICFSILILTVPLWISNPKWINDFFSNLSENPQWIQPSIFSQLYIRMGGLGVGLWLILYILVLILSLRFYQKSSLLYAVLWSIALTTIVSPYVWSWDFVLLLPLFIDTAVRLTSNTARIILFGFYTFSLIFSVISLQSGNKAGDDVLWWFPIVIITGIILSLRLSRVTISNI